MDERTDERSNDRMNGRTNHELSDERSDERTKNMWTNELRTGGRTIEERPNDPCASVCLCGRWSGSGRVGVGVGREGVAMKWLGVG